MRRIYCSIVLLLCGTFLAGSVLSQEYPNKPIRLLVGFPPGGNVDPVARIIAEQLKVRFGKPVVVENRSGATGTIAGQVVAESAPDGYTLVLMTAGAMTITPYIEKIRFKPEDLEPVVLVVEYGGVLVVHYVVPARTLRQYVSLAKAKPGVLNVGSAGLGSVYHMAVELLNRRAGIQTTSVQYRGAGQITVDLLGGQIDATFNSSFVVHPHVVAGRLRAIATTRSHRDSIFPKLPTIAETYPGYDIHGWMGFFVPKGTPVGIINRLNREINAVLEGREINSRLVSLGYDVTPGSPKEFEYLVQKDTALYAAILAKR